MVLVSHNHKFIFLKTRKTAGTSVEMALEHVCAPAGHVAAEKTPTRMSEQGIIGSRISPITLPPQPALEKGLWYNHKSAKEIREDLGVERFERYLKITTVRNPFDRCVSAFHWLRKPESAKAKNFAELRQKFQDFILAEKWKTDTHNALIKGEYIIDRTLRFETLKPELAKDLNIAVNINAMPHVKSTHETRKDYAVADYYNQACIDTVRRRSDWVFEYCDYPDHP